MKALSFPLANLLLSIVPATRLFGLKRVMLRILGIEVGHGCRVAGLVKFYGRGHIKFGTDCWIGIGSVFIVSPDASVEIGANCDIAPFVIFHTGTHLIGDSIRRAGAGVAVRIIVGSGSWIGTRSTLLGGVELGASTIVGAGSVVLPARYLDDSLLAGVPAIFKKRL